MHFFRVTSAIAILLMAGSPASFADDDPKTTTNLKVGFAERDITPEIGMEAPGGYGKSYHQTFHDACKVRASVFDDGKSRVAIVGIDALGIRADTVTKVRQAIEAKTGIPTSAILVGASHSHSSGPCLGTFPEDYLDASKFVQDLSSKQSTSVDAKYLARVETALVDAVVAANTARNVAKAGIGKGIESNVAFNRRFLMKDGHAVTHPGLGNPDIIEPAGPVDPEVGVIGVWDSHDPNKLLGCIVNFACHATTSPGGISANYVHYLEKVIQGYYGKHAVVVFLAGASGDITQVDNRSPYVYPNGEKWAQIVGGKVGSEALKVLLTMETGQPSPVSAQIKTWDIKRRVPSPERVRQCLEIVKQPQAKVDPTEWTFAKEIVLLDHLLKREPSVRVEVQAIQVGPAVFVTTPAEYFCQYGLEIKAKSGFPYTFPVSLANGCVGYVPTEDAFGAKGGGYETRLTSYSNLEITAGTQMQNAGIELARKLKPGAVINPPARPTFTGMPSTYGNARPERN